jgi:hypothetical protein
VVHQRILEWSPPDHLSFRMERSGLAVERFVESIVETIDLVPTPGGVFVTRTTTVGVRGRWPRLRALLLSIGLKDVHRYVFRNWQRLAAHGAPVVRAGDGAAAPVGGS